MSIYKIILKDQAYQEVESDFVSCLDALKHHKVKDFDKVVDSCPVPIVIAGGKKLPEKDALQMAYDAIQTGAIGVDMGRNIFQSSSPVAMIKAVNAIVHKKANPKEALDIFTSHKK